jgi:NAD(P)H-dependent FMN reductase
VTEKKNVLAIVGSADKNSSNQNLVNRIEELTRDNFNLTIFNSLSSLPHFNPELSIDKTPQKILDFRELILKADGIIICTPEYIFSIPSGLKNAIEWCVATTIFSNKPVGLITASASGQKGHEELQLIMKTIEAKFTEHTTLLIQGIKGKFDNKGNLTDPVTIEKLNYFLFQFEKLLEAKRINL